jgi:Kef-type K+ transport system membrane component KefB
MQRSDWVVIGIVLVVDLLAIIAIAILTVLAGPVWAQFVIMLAMFIVTLIGAYWVLFAPEDISKERGGDGGK